MTSAASQSLTYPYAGQLYLAVSPSLTRRGLVKFGSTLRTAVQRSKEHPGVLSTEKSQPILVLESLDCRKAEDQLRELLGAGLMLPFGRKDLARCSPAVAKSLARSALRDAPVRTGRAAPETAPNGRLMSAHPVANQLLTMKWGIGKCVLTLEQWLLSALTDSSVAAKLHRYGVICTNASRSTPEFLLQGRVLADAQVWLASQELDAARLQEPEARMFRWLL